MDKEKCKSCGMRHVCSDSGNSWFFFLIGIIATISLRVIEPLRNVNPLYAKLSWYIGVSGFFLFFVYKYKVLRARSKIIRETGLKEKLVSSSKLSDKDYVLIAEIICSQDNWKERVNFIVIFVLSAIALAFALWIELSG